MTSRLQHCVLIGIALAATLGSAVRADEGDREGERMIEVEGVVRATERQLTFTPHGHILTNIGVWSRDSRWIAYDVRSDPAGSVFDGRRIEQVDVASGQVRVVYTSAGGAHCGVVTVSPIDDRVVFIHGPEHPTPDWQYAAYHRRGVLVDADAPGTAVNLDARDLTVPLTPGALRGGTHVHTFSADGRWVAFTYEDHLLAARDGDDDCDRNQRNVGISVAGRAVAVDRDHPRNHDGSYFTVLVTRTINHPRPGSDEIDRAFQDAWVGTGGYLREDGSRQRRAIAFLGNVVTKDGESITELFLVDLPDDLTRPGDGPLEGTATRRPAPPRGVVQRRLTHTDNRRHPGVQGPRHWPRSNPDGSQIAVLMRDDEGVVQIYTISPRGGDLRQLTHGHADVESAFSWSPDGRWLAHVTGGQVCITDADSGRIYPLTAATDESSRPRPEACVFSPDGRQIAYVRRVTHDNRTWNQIFVLTLQWSPS